MTLELLVPACHIYFQEFDHIVPPQFQVVSVEAIACRGESMGLLTQFNLLGEAPVFLEAVALLKRVVACEVTVLLQGEIGTVKLAPRISSG
jgi:DNA-binding NtrC family response regulator